MTQDEVDLIYDYLHENYEYREGDLFRNKKLGKWEKSTPIGTLFHREGARFEIRTGIRIKGKTYSMPVSKFIYIFHLKKYPNYIDFVDGNPVNMKIENLIDIKRRNKKLHKEVKGYTKVKTKSGYKFKVTIFMRGKTLNLGQYFEEKIAGDIYRLALDLSVNTTLSVDQIKLMVSEKYPEYKVFRGNKNGYKGVNNYREGKYSATITIKNKSKHVGVYDTPEEAHAAYLKAKEEYKNG